MVSTKEGFLCTLNIVYRTLMKECPWVEHLTSPRKGDGVGAVLSANYKRVLM